MASLPAALACMGVPKSIADMPCGEVAVFVCFGLVAVTGTDRVLNGQVGATSALASVAIGGPAAAALALNNHRDIAHDRLVGRRATAVAFGEAGSRRLFAALPFGPFVLVLVLVPAMALSAQAVGMLLPRLLRPSARRVQRMSVRGPRGGAMNEVLHANFRLELWFAASLSADALRARRVA